ncbi:hypothetical protein [Chlamydiifrater volucris]|uniref:hypothetical protein n=1 Tax=Chlamydiifrater volucris TaxID=2681470 RepID=UPI001BCEB266|nr:hypothetical protein [Chlamydiifrater volucris]
MISSVPAKIVSDSKGLEILGKIRDISKSEHVFAHVLTLLSGLVLCSIAVLSSVIFFEDVGVCLFGTTSAILSVTLVSLMVSVLLFTVICCVSACKWKMLQEPAIEKGKAMVKKDAGWTKKKLTALFSRKQGRKFLSQEASLNLFSKIRSEKDLAAQVEICSKVILQGGFVKTSVRDGLNQLSNETKLQLSFPLFASQRLDNKDFPVFDPHRMEGQVAHSVPEAFLGRVDVPFLKKVFKCGVFLERFSRELFFIGLGVFSGEKMQEIRGFLGNKLNQKNNENNYQDLYAQLIYSFPEVVAVEALFLNWLKKIYPHILLCESFRDYNEYFIKGLCNVSFFETESIKFLEHFSGIIPAVVALFCKEDKLSFRCERRMTWSFFCDKAMEYMKKTSLDIEFWGDFNKFSRFLDLDEEVFIELKPKTVFYDRHELNFIERPYSLWNMKKFINAFPDLKEKIKEGLEVLQEIECSGGKLSELVSMEQEVLGLE